MRRLWRVVRWWLKCLWAGKVVPRKLPGAPYSRSYMRKIYKPYLQSIDRQVEELRFYSKTPHMFHVHPVWFVDVQQALNHRRLLVKRRKLFLMPQGVE